MKVERQLRLAFASLAVIALAPIAVLAILGDLHHPSDARIAAVLTFAGVLLTALTTVIGTLSRQRSEERLRLEAAMHAGEIFNPSSSGPPHPAAAAAGLLALTRLQRADLAVAILVDVWDARRTRHARGDGSNSEVLRPNNVTVSNCVSNETAILVLDAALQADNRTQLVAAEVLCRNAAALNICESLHWPAMLDEGWDPDFGVRTKILLVEALIQMALAHPVNLSSLQWLTIRLYGISVRDPNRYVKGCLGILLQPLLDALEKARVESLMFGRSEILRHELEKALTYPQIHKDRVFLRLAQKYGKELKDWAVECHDPDFAPGALATATVSGFEG